MKYARMVVALVLLSSCLVFADQGVRKPSSKNRPVPYPETARRMHLAGAVRLDVMIAANGKVKKVDVLGGNPVLAAAAVNAVKDWTYEPAPSDSSETIVVKFDQK